jgi:hypothetical protein
VSKRKEVTTEVLMYGADRMGCSVNGNPRWSISTADGTYVTQSDSACSYDVDNIRRTIPYEGSIRVRLTTTPAKRVLKIEVLTP